MCHGCRVVVARGNAEMGAWAKCSGSGSPRALCGNKAMDLSHAHVSHSRGHCRGPTDVSMDQTSLVSWLGHGAKLKPSACLPGETALGSAATLSLQPLNFLKKNLKVKRSDFDP